MAARKPTFKSAAAAVVKKHGIGALVSLDQSVIDEQQIDAISTGAILLDLAIGCGGFPRGRIVELYGNPSSGKSSLALACAHQAQLDNNGSVLYLDFENSFDPYYAGLHGVDLSADRFQLAQPTTLEEGMTIAEEFIESDTVDLIICDSLASMPTKKEIEGEIEDSTIAEQARAMSKVLRRLTKKISASGVVMIFLNHVRVPLATFGKMARKTTPGGTALKFYASVRVELITIKSFAGKIEDRITGGLVDGPVAVKILAKVVKNKTGAPFREGTFYIRDKFGLFEPQTIVEIAEGRGIVKKSGNFYVLPFRNAKKQNGLEALLRWLSENGDKYRILRDAVMDALAQNPSSEPETKPQKIREKTPTPTELAFAPANLEGESE